MFPVRYTTPNLTSLSKQGEGEPHGVQGGEHWGQPGLLDLPASGNAVNTVFRKRSTGVPISSILFKRIYFMGTHFISVSNDIMSRRISIGQVLQQPQDLSGMPTRSSHCQEAERPPRHRSTWTQDCPQPHCQQQLGQGSCSRREDRRASPVV